MVQNHMAAVCPWTKITVFLFAAVQVVGAQEGFVSLLCGGKSNIIEAETKLVWIPDDNYTLYKGEIVLYPSPVEGSQPKPIRQFSSDFKSCYNLTTVKGDLYLIRGSFIHGELYGRPLFDVSIDATVICQVNTSVSALRNEVILTATENYVTYCLIPKRHHGAPFISQLELRPLNRELYTSKDPQKILKMLTRIDLGNNGSVSLRYPNDSFDRIWDGDPHPICGKSISSKTNFSTSDNKVPNQVLQTAKMGSCGKRLELLIDNENQEAKDYLVILYFREVDDKVQVGERVFDIHVNGELMHSHVDILANGTEQYKLLNFEVHAVGGLNISLEGTSKLSPICNAYEAYEIITKKAGTAESDVSALVILRDALLESNPKLLALQSWSGDPCLPILENGQSTSWVGVTCKSDQGRQIVTELDLSCKNLQGQMPSSINNLVNLEKLNISDNKLEGSMPELPNLTRLTSFDIRWNNFKGNFPISIIRLANLTDFRLIGCNPQLNTSIPEGCLKCNYSDKGCEGNSGQKNTQTVVIGGFVGGSVFLLVTVGVMFSCFYRRRKMVDANETPNYKENSIKSFNIEIFTLKGLASATNNYQIKIGEGGFGVVYRGTLADGQEVAVKVRSTTSIQGMREFETELNLLSKIRHENLVPLLGYCPEKDQQILVYPFMSNGSLQDRLYGEAAKRKPLDWQTRISIALGAARGLHFLHTSGERCIIHRDIKSSNILLDQSMVAKVADFGFSKYAPQDGDNNVSLEVRGTAGYLDPEYYSSQQLTVKSDVFSFGVVLLEIICGREPLNIHRPRSEWSLVEWAKPFIQDSNIDAIVDPVIRTSYVPEAMWRVVETAMTSVEPFSVRRPSMEDIVRELEDAFIIENNASQYMKSISGSFRFSMDPKSLPPVAYTPNEPSSVFSETLGSPHPR
ncbi:nodulation receptor kinase isoform X1 [Cryptomeria japonica]|uniref:nodulation receptor kinase isoform X1 n=1 Tax=Cryptomeria japonica TaxID=3369 RepID=UPI0025ABF77E|nr:nodulation receptor kinase isoform X1 [Cryptomeria japonica]XP_057854219.1 nodulation receptor kinase isoform X1 [Cryptomeria japonica]